MRICAVIVAYNPNKAVLDRLIETARIAVDCVLVVNNGGLLSVNADLIQNAENVGLGAALNQGILWAKKRLFTSVILFDQDSQPKAGMIQTLRDALESLQASGQKVAAVGPSLLDPRTTKRLPFVQWKFPKNRMLRPDKDPIQTDFLITSGSLIPMSVIDDIGPMDATLFIDNIDMEWCARARKHGYLLFGVPTATMIHSIGDRIITLRFLGRTRNIMVHNPTRLYYIMRNRILLYGMPHVSWPWMLNDILRIPVKFGIFALFVPRRWENVKHMTVGLLHGILGRR